LRSTAGLALIFSLSIEVWVQKTFQFFYAPMENSSQVGKYRTMVPGHKNTSTLKAWTEPASKNVPRSGQHISLPEEEKLSPHRASELGVPVIMDRGREQSLGTSELAVPFIRRVRTEVTVHRGGLESRTRAHP
jgi:hypothetical protein